MKILLNGPLRILISHDSTFIGRRGFRRAGQVFPVEAVADEFEGGVTSIGNRQGA